MEQHTIDIEETEALANEAACIFRVHEGLRNANEKAYTPILISIGPYHRGQPKLLAMEKRKEHYLELLLQRSNQRKEDYLESMKKLEKRARKYYADPVDHLDSDEFVKMMLYDACFVIEFLFGLCEFYAVEDKHQQSPVGDEVKVLWKRSQICNDLMLLENQLPFFVICKVFAMSYGMTVAQNPNQNHPDVISTPAPAPKAALMMMPMPTVVLKSIDISKIDLEDASVLKSKHFLDLVRNVCLPSSSSSASSSTSDKSNDHQNKNKRTCHKLHFLDLVHNVCLPSSSSSASSSTSDKPNDHQNKNKRTCHKLHFLDLVHNVCFPSSSTSDKSNDHQNKNKRTCHKLHFLDLVRNVCLPSSSSSSSSTGDKSNDHQNKNKRTCQLPCVMELKDAGVKFEAVENDDDELNLSMFDIRFKGGHFKIPKFSITDDTETFFRNIIAYEQHSSSEGNEPKYFSDYTYFMDKLINTKEDVNELCRNEILDNWLGDDEEVALMFNNLCKGMFISDKFYYDEQCRKVDDHCKRPWNRGVASLKRDYFRNIWVTVATFAAGFLLLLTITQTVIALITIIISPPSRH